MKLIKQLNELQPVVEDAAGGATGAGSVAGAGLPLFAKLVKHTKGDKEKVADSPVKPAKKPFKMHEAFIKEELDSESGEDPARQRRDANDEADTIARLKALETRNSEDKRDCVTFGLEDDDGNIVRVSIAPDQAEEFEKVLQAYANDPNEDAPEIGEILFDLRDHFDIIDVDWPAEIEDEEEIQDVAGVDGDEMPPEGEMPPEDMGAPDMAGEEQAASLLTQVIDMMKADAEARYAEAKAREAEAKTREANAIVAQSMQRVKQEEQLLDMEQAQKSQKAEQKEAKRLAQLARYKSEVKQDVGFAGDDDDVYPTRGAEQGFGVENEEVARPTSAKKIVRPRAAPKDIASFILNRVKV